jgi:hypothetical protein
MRRVVAQARKELTQICRDWRTLALALVLPLVLLLLMSVSLSLTVNNLPIIVQDFDDSSASRDFVDAIRASISLSVVSWPIDRPPEEALSSNAARAVLIIPPHFGRDMARGVNSPVQLLLDASDANTAKTHGGLCQRNYACLQSTHRWHSRHRAGPNRNPPLVQPRTLLQEILRSRDLRAGTLDVPSFAGLSRHGKRIGAEDNSSSLCLQHLRARIPAGKDSCIHGSRARRVCGDARSPVYIFWFGAGRRSNPLHRRHDSLHVLRGGLWNDGGSDDSEPGRRDASGGPRRLSPGVSALRV